MALLGLLAIPLIVMLVGFFLSKGRITGKEFAVQFGVTVVLVAGGFFIGRWDATQDVEIWNGRIAKKDHGTEHCCHAYRCNCHEVCSGSGKNRSCHERCSTCYRHFYDKWWNSTTTNDERVFSDSCNSPSTSPPDRWVQIRVGEPTAVEHTYTNYIKAAPGTILRRQGLLEKYKKLIPQYPEVYDHYLVNRFFSVSVNTEGLDWNRLNSGLAEINADLGARKQVNVIVLVVPIDDRGYLHGLEEAWLGGKKNDLVVVVGTPNFPKISWVGVMSWTKMEEMKLAIRDRIENLGTFDGEKILDIIRAEVEGKFVRRPMADFAYLSSSITPSSGVMVFLFILGLVVCGGLQWYFWMEDPFGYGQSRYRRRLY